MKWFWIVVGAMLIIVGIILSFPLVPGPGWLLWIPGTLILTHEIPWLKKYEERFKKYLKRRFPVFYERIIEKLIRRSERLLQKLNSRFKKR